MKCNSLMKRLLTLVLCASLCASALGGCADSGGSILAVDNDEEEETEKKKKSSTKAATEEDVNDQTDEAQPAEKKTKTQEEDPADIHVSDAQMTMYDKYVNSCVNAVEACDGCADCLEYAVAINQLTYRLESADYNWLEDREVPAGIFKLMRDKLLQVEPVFYEHMAHNCYAEIEYVYDYPLTVNDYSGTYTGYWMGLGPEGEGVFTGSKMYQLRGEYFDMYYSYSGNWGCGAPNGEGTYRYVAQPQPGISDSYMEKRYYEEVYSGQMMNGKKNGYGTLVSVFDGDPLAVGTRVSYFGEGYYVDDELYGEVDFVNYDSQGLLSYGIAVQYGTNGTDGYGSLIPKEFSDTRAWSEQRKEQIMQAAAGIAITGMLIFVTSKVAQSDNEWYNNWSAKQDEAFRLSQQQFMEDRAKAEAEAAENEQKARDEQEKRNLGSLYEKYYADDPNGDMTALYSAYGNNGRSYY